MDSTSRIVVVENDGISIVRFIDRKIVDSTNIEQLGKELTDLVVEEQRNMLLLDFSAVEFMSSAALNKLISLNNKVKQADGKLILCSLRAEIREVFTITRLDRVFDIQATQDDGMRVFQH